MAVIVLTSLISVSDADPCRDQLQNTLFREGATMAFKDSRRGGWAYFKMFMVSPITRADIQEIEDISKWERYNVDPTLEKETYPPFEVLYITPLSARIAKTNRAAMSPFVDEGFRASNGVIIPYHDILGVKMGGDSKAAITWKKIKRVFKSNT